jgi:ribosomal protein L7Ae-like RNA K-turn-binding protein
MLKEDKVAGARQVLRGIRKGTISSVLVAEDTDAEIKRQVLSLTEANNIPVSFCESKSELGREIGIEKACSAVGFVKRSGL